MTRPNPTTVPAKPQQTEPDHVPTPGTVLIALTTNLACWFLTGVIGYNFPALPAKDDLTIMALLLWMPQAFAIGYLLWIAASRGWSTPAAISSAIIVGISTAFWYGLCWAEWGNAATYGFWITGGVHAGLGLEGMFGVAEAAERRLGRMLAL